jgi:hypothetical protein
MERETKLNNVLALIDDVDFPVERETAAEELSDVRLILADGEANLGELISETASESFESPADIETALHNVLPREAVGEPYQSEGDA